MRRLVLSLLAVVALTFPATASASSVIVEPGDFIRIPCYVIPKNMRVTTGLEYLYWPLKVVSHETTSDGYVTIYALGERWDARVDGFNPDEGPLYLAQKTLAYNTGAMSVTFNWPDC